MHTLRCFRFLVAATLIALVLHAPTAAPAGVLISYAVDSGTYSDSGYHSPSNTSYVVGNFDLGLSEFNLRNFLVFSIPSSMANANRTLLSVYAYYTNLSDGYVSPDSSETFAVTKVTTSVATLRAGGSGLTSIYSDLGTGSGTYGTRVISSADTNVVLSVNLGTNANSDIVDHAGDYFAIGGTLTSLGSSGSELVFSGSDADTSRFLWINYADSALSATNASIGNTLVGNSKSAAVSARNSGDPGSTLTGSIGGSSDSEITPTSGSTAFSLAANAYAWKTFTYTPTERGTDSTTISITSNAGSDTATVSGQGVAPLEAFGSSTLAAGNVRIGTSANLSTTIRNTGDGNLSGLGSTSNLRGTFSLQTGSSEFSGITTGSISLADGASQTIGYAYTPTNHGADSRTLTLSYLNGSDNGKNQANTQTATFTGTGVGPEFASSVPVGSTIDFGTVSNGSPASWMMTLENATPDGDLGSLTDLTILDVIFSGPDSGLFSLSTSILGTVLAADETLSFDVLFQGTPLAGLHTATLTFVTDQNAPLGSVGSSFSYSLAANVLPVPEPSALVLLGLGAVGLFGYRCRRRRAG